ncbi:glutamate 5-kinase [Schaalia sp. 19OD2882]|uniref:glutamate 5-kinase n=1 Tax=Schaalia sp. 19OD2882 TaxID=2794089 RepID=UPI001C1F0143|nr:glutamate 5-kinase [Schaalia sp. 19OD2882]QWW18889.1 glutamate 5-kinase [Schaalia sp. 19OD2882]
MRQALAGARRIVVKIGSSSLTREDGGLDLNRIDVVARLAAQWQSGGREMVIVSSGAVAAGLGSLGLDARPKDLATVQAVAAMGQGVLVAHWSQAFQAHHRHVAQVLLTTEDVMRREHYTNARSALEKLLSHAVVPIINENDAVTTPKVRFGDNDRLAAYVAQMVAADVLVLLTDVDGLYTAPPSHPGATLVRTVSATDDLHSVLVTGAGSKVGSGGMVTKMQAATMAAGSGIGVVLTSAPQLAGALAGAEVGTWFEPSSARPASRTLWIAHAAQSMGEVVVDRGAVHALTVGKKSLLAAGVREVSGSFEAGDVVDVVHPGSGLVARGVCAYDSDTVAAMAGLGRADLESQGWQHPRPVIHRDDLAILV